MFASERRICLPLWDDLEECWVILGCYKASIRRDLENHKRLGYLWMPVFCSSDGHRLIVSTCPSCQRSQSLRSLSRIAAFTVLCKSIPLRHDHHLLPGQPSFDQNLNDMKPLFAPTYFLCIKLQMLCCNPSTSWLPFLLILTMVLARAVEMVNLFNVHLKLQILGGIPSIFDFLGLPQQKPITPRTSTLLHLLELWELPNLTR